MKIKTAKDFIGIGHEPNFQIKGTDGNQYWISRSVAVLAAVVTNLRNEWYVLVNQRGEGCPDFQGYWNIPCGYLDWGESCQEACSREVHEECGIEISPDEFRLFAVESDPAKSNKQNVTIRHIAIMHPDVMLEELNDAFSEKEEVSSIKWVKFSEIDDYKWAFNHREILDTIHGELQKNEKYF